MKLKPASPEAMRLFMEGTLALAQIEHWGVRVDVSYLDRMLEETAKKLREHESELRKSEVWGEWRKRYGDKATLGSPQQLAEVLRRMDLYEAKDFTPTGLPQMSAADLSRVEHPFCKQYDAWKKLSKARSTYLLGIRREVVKDRVHCSYSLAGGNLSDEERGGAQSYRGSCSSFNFQNLPIRNPLIADLIRRIFIPSNGYLFGDVDFSQLEVRISAAYNKDPALIDYVKDPKTDMHRDTAMDLFLLTMDQVDKKTTRDWAKNRFVFALFYGAVYYQQAPSLWEAICGGAKIPGTEITVKQHLASKGIKELDIVMVRDPKTGKMRLDHEPKPGSFGDHVKKAERILWDQRFPVYRDWKNSFFRQYQREGGFDLLTGFRVNGVHKKNDVTNYPVQGAAFHCLLWSLIQIVKWIKKYKLKSRVVGQIHDSLVLDIYDSELEDVLAKCEQVMTVDLPRHWRWINVPLAVEAEVAPDGLSWWHKEAWSLEHQNWVFNLQPKKKK